ncbi:shikimate dehydrogenase [Albidovulum inexpectatum]|uniref:Shikimate dehydrogenase n=1 Tax=Albidovulum inexpectatum TaxID=196587 RepID=A0A2S5JHE7_9RHOB|nr:shikimate dehydrogenase [Albidovulum inexpectatum]PPB80903.1 shikimate dehydrogenase [Albidovulum inexpectatum]
MSRDRHMPQAGTQGPDAGGDAARSARSFLIGLIGAGIGPSRTPAMHEAAARALGVSLSYRRLDLDLWPDRAGATPDLARLLALAEWMGFDGLNVTFPCKQAIVPLLDDLSPNARGLEAVNTVILRDGRRMGHNTDIWGFAESFRRELSGAPRGRVLQLGAGGAGAATGYALLCEGVGELCLYDPRADQARALAAALARSYDPARIRVIDEPASVLGACDGVVNASPVGMAKLPGCPVDPDRIPASAWVADVIYFPRRTALIEAAAARGCRVMTGESMALWQAVRAFRLFTGLEPDPAVMHAALMGAAAGPDTGAEGAPGTIIHAARQGRK